MKKRTFCTFDVVLKDSEIESFELTEPVIEAQAPRKMEKQVLENLTLIGFEIKEVNLTKTEVFSLISCKNEE